MTRKYKVEVSVMVPETALIEVEAENADEANKKALKTAMEGMEDLQWEIDRDYAPDGLSYSATVIN